MTHQNHTATLIMPDGLAPSAACIIPVCSGTAAMQGKTFLSYAAAAAQRFSKCHLVLADTLDAYNMADPAGPDWSAACDVARNFADLWQTKHLRDLMALFHGNVTLTRWDDVRADETFPARFEASKALYASAPPVAAWVDDVCGRYTDIAVERARARGGVPNRAAMFSRSVAYMLEEIAGSAVYAQWFNAPAVYPGEYFAGPKSIQMHNRFACDLTVPAHIGVDFGEKEGRKAA